jgi:CRISPR-associated protein Csb2
MDHVLVYAPMGFDEAARIALSAVHRTYAKGLPDIFVTLAGMGERSTFDKLVHEIREARVWRSSMPFVLPRYLKPRGRNTLVGQVQDELASRGMPPATDVEIQLDDGSFAPGPSYWEAAAANRLAKRFRHIRRERLDRPPPMSRGLSLRITFAEEVRGPIALGYGAHFGLGVLVPEGGH